MTVSEYIKKLLSLEEYSFSKDELLQNCSTTPIAQSRELSRLVEKKEIINLRKGFYLIITPRYSKQGKLPLSLYVQKLFEHLNKNYYVGLYSAAKLYGAGHQQIQREYIIISPPSLLSIKKHAIDIKILTASKWSKENIISKKSDAGLFEVSSPALTATDLIHHQSKLGGINRNLAILEELGEEITQSDLKSLMSWYPYKSTLQRFGFLMDELNYNQALIKIVEERLSQLKTYPVLLSVNINENPGAVNNRWKIDVNIQMQSDL